MTLFCYPNLSGRGRHIMAKLRQFEINKYFHSYSRGVDRCDIFREHNDYLKFMALVENLNCKETKREVERNKGKKTKLVDVFCYTLMPNHFHFILKELTCGGISKFMHKVLGAYATYFNDKYGRVGALFGQRFKDKLIDTDQYFEHLVGYIWNNPIKLIRQDYSSKDLFNGDIKLTEQEKNFALNYPYKKFPKNYFGPEHKKLTKTYFDIFDF